MLLGCGQCLITFGQVIAIASTCAVPIVCNKATQMINKKRKKKFKDTINNNTKDGK